MTVRIVVTGPESTGKTTLAFALAAYLDAPVVPEAARMYADAVSPRALLADDVEPIARLAVQLNDDLRRLAPPVVVLDTDLISTVVYARHYYGTVSPWIVAEARARRGTLYLQCDTDLPWVNDPVRDDAATRALLADRFTEALREFECVGVRIDGIGEARLARARAAVASHLDIPSATASRGC